MLEDQFHFQLLKCFNHQKRWINQRTIQIDVLPGQSKVLQCLDEHGPLSPKEIGKLCIVDKSTTTSLLNKMEKMNYIEKKGTMDPKALNQWKFVPEKWTVPAAQRDSEYLFRSVQ